MGRSSAAGKAAAATRRANRQRAKDSFNKAKAKAKDNVAYNKQHHGDPKTSVWWGVGQAPEARHQDRNPSGLECLRP